MSANGTSRDTRDSAFQQQLDDLRAAGEAFVRTLRSMETRLDDTAARLEEAERTVARLTGDLAAARDRITALEAGQGRPELP